MLHIFLKNTIHHFINFRQGETKLGQTIQVASHQKNIKKSLQHTSAKFIIFGVPEDIGVKMNYGIGGAHTAFIPAIKALVNTQENQFIQGKDILILGYLDMLDHVQSFNGFDREKGDFLVKALDIELSKIVKTIVEAGKIPIVIGGGHNNAYGNLKGVSEAKKMPVNAINLDAHSDLRKLEERHSGNGFSYAISNNYLQKYFIFGLHENYTPNYIFEYILNNIHIEYTTFEELEIYQTTSFERELQRAKNFIEKKSFGIEIDLDAVQNFLSSAMTPTGFSPQQARRFVHFFGKNKHATYLHICEGAPTLVKESNATKQIGKFISYLITDFIKAQTTLTIA